MAAPRPMAETMGGVPASNLAGSSAGSKPPLLNAADHAAAAEERGHRVEQFAAAPQHADAGGPEHFVAAEGDEVGTQRLHIERKMRSPLGGVDQCYGSNGTSPTGDFGDRD